MPFVCCLIILNLKLESGSRTQSGTLLNLNKSGIWIFISFNPYMTVLFQIMFGRFYFFMISQWFTYFFWILEVSLH